MKRRRRKKRKVWIWCIVITMLVLIILIIAGIQIHKSVLAAGQGQIFSLDDDIPHKKVALVLGARVYESGRLSPMLRDRVDAAIKLYKNGTVEKLLMSGDNRRRHYNEPSAMRDYAIEHGVPSNDVVRDFAGFRTYDSVYRAHELWDLDEMIIVSQQFHLPRALYIAENLGVDAVGVAAAHYDYDSLSRAELREIPARLLAWVDVLVGRDPYFLGPDESLSGDAQQPRIEEE